ncbi:MAG: corrinoid protein [Clostridia bacterium]|nr:corrinoid protein [Clostridia bacterium]
MTDLVKLSDFLVTGDKDNAIATAKALLESGTAPLDIINNGLITGMSRVGELFKEGEMFVPEVMLSAQVMTETVATIKPYIKEGEMVYKGKIVIGTVKGDLHDIGKNLVALMLENNGFEVINLGSDKGPNDFLAAIEKHEPQIIALSALLTTTMPMMSKIIEAVDKEGLRPGVNVIIGGAPVTQDFADKIGANGYSEDATGAVMLCQKLLHP